MRIVHYIHLLYNVRTCEGTSRHRTWGLLSPLNPKPPHPCISLKKKKNVSFPRKSEKTVINAYLCDSIFSYKFVSFQEIRKRDTSLLSLVLVWSNFDGILKAEDTQGWNHVRGEWRLKCQRSEFLVYMRVLAHGPHHLPPPPLPSSSSLRRPLKCRE